MPNGTTLASGSKPSFVNSLIAHERPPFRDFRERRLLSSQKMCTFARELPKGDFIKLNAGAVVGRQLHPLHLGCNFGNYSEILEKENR